MTEDMSDFAVREVLNGKLEKNPDQCPICTGSIGTTISTMYDRACSDCGTKFRLDREGEDGLPIPSVAFETTPHRRIKKQLRQRAAERAVFEELSEE